MAKKKILLLSDDLRMYSGVSTVSREIILNTVKDFDWVQLGAAVVHPDQGKIMDISSDVKKQTGVDDAYVRIYCSSGYGNPEVLRELLYLERPDAIMHFTDPRFWGWLYQMEHELRQALPLIYYTIWDSTPFPKYNTPYYESCDLLMCISKQTHNIVKQLLKSKNYEDWQVTYVPHGINENTFYPIDETNEEFVKYKQSILNGDEKFVVFHNARNIRRKHTSDMILAFNSFCDSLPKEEADKCLLLLHTDPIDENGTDLPSVIKEVCKYNVRFTPSRVINSMELNYLYNLADVTMNIASNEGFGLGTAESVMAGTPIIVNVTGGLQDQCGFKTAEGEYITEAHYNETFQTNADKVYTEHGEWVAPVFPKVRTLQGSVPTPYIFDDIACYKDAADAIKYWYNKTKEERKDCGRKGREYFLSEQSGLSAKEMGKRVVQNINTLFVNWKPRKKVELVKI